MSKLNKKKSETMVIVIDEFASLKEKLEGEPHGREMINQLKKHLKIANLKDERS